MRVEKTQSRVCLVYTGTGACSTVDSEDTSARLRGIQVGSDNDTVVHFIIPNIGAAESGIWNITMYRNPTSPQSDSRQSSTLSLVQLQQCFDLIGPRCCYVSSLMA